MNRCWKNRCWKIGIFVVTITANGCGATLVTRSLNQQAVDRAVVALAVAHSRNVSPPAQKEVSPPPAQPPARQHRLVIAYLQPGHGCPPCRRFELWWRNLTPAQREDLPVTFRIEQDNIPPWVQEFPTFHWSDSSGRSWIVSGWNGIEAFLEIDHVSSLSPIQNRMAPAGANRTLNAGDWSHLITDTLKSGEVPLNSRYSLWIPPAETIRLDRDAARGTITFEAPFPLLRLNWHGVRYDDSIRKLSVTPGKISMTLGTFGEIAFEVQT